jgi:tetratricopeptide (TPR) repeat protein
VSRRGAGVAATKTRHAWPGFRAQFLALGCRTTPPPPAHAPMLGRSLCKLGRHDEAEPLAQLGCELGAPEDVNTQMLWRQVQALVDSHRGRHSHAEQLAREAVAVSERTDALNLQGDALSDLAEVLHAAGRTDEAVAVLDQALDRYDRKRNLAQAAETRDRLVALRGGAPL